MVPENGGKLAEIWVNYSLNFDSLHLRILFYLETSKCISSLILISFYALQ